MGFSLCPIWRRRRTKGPAPREAHGNKPEARKRETLRKKALTHPTPSCESSSATIKKDDVPRAVELDNHSPFQSPVDGQPTRQADQRPTTPPQLELSVDLPAECAELSAEPPLRPIPDEQPAQGTQPDGSETEAKGSNYVQETASASGGMMEAPAEQRRQFLPDCPPFLIPGLPPAAPGGTLPNPPRRASTWSEELSKSAAFALTPRPYGFGIDWQSRIDLLEHELAVWQAVSPSEVSPSGTPRTVRTASDSSLTRISSLSTESLVSPMEIMGLKYPLSRHQKIVSGVPSKTISTQSSMSSLSQRVSSANLDQLLARHALLESRRQILLQLHEVEQEQELILEELATMPEE